MKRSVLTALAAAALFSLGTAQAARYQLTYTDTFEETQWNPTQAVLDTQTGTLTAFFEGTLQGDNDTIEITDWEAGGGLVFNGTALALPALNNTLRAGTSRGAPARVSLSGNTCNLYADDASGDYYSYCSPTPFGGGGPMLSVWYVNLEYIATFEAANLSVTLASAPVPEPSTALLSLLGLPALVLAARRRKVA